MIVLRYLLFPFAVLYGLVTSLRNFLFDKGILKSYSFPIPILAVGNLSVGGTGKTPQIEYLIRLLSPKCKVATLSRGYKRKSVGFVLADAHSNAAILGDEPFQMHLKFPDVIVAVDADRKNGIEKLMALHEAPDVILLDDAFQHRRVKAGFYILLTAYDDLFCDDFMLPTGLLRECRKGAKRANIVIVTKCPATLSKEEQDSISKRIGVNAPIYFSTVNYDEKICNEKETKTVCEMQSIDKLLLAGIAKPAPFFSYLGGNNDTQLTFPDHHHFTEIDIKNIKKTAGNKLIITTEKDYVRLKHQLPEKQLFYLPIKTEFISNSADFDARIISFLESNLT